MQSDTLGIHWTEQVSRYLFYCILLSSPKDLFFIAFGE